MARTFRRGWYGDSYRHYLSSKGINSRTRFFAKGNRENIGVTVDGKNFLKVAYANGVTKEELGLPYAEKNKGSIKATDPRFIDAVVRAKQASYATSYAGEEQLLPPQQDEMMVDDSVQNVALMGASDDASDTPMGTSEDGAEPAEPELLDEPTTNLPGQDVGASVIATPASPPLFARKQWRY